MTYSVKIAKDAAKALASLPRKDQQRARAAIDLLSETPRPPTCVAVRGETNVYRVRVGDYRIIYEVFDDRLIVHVVRVAHRREAYRKR